MKKIILILLAVIVVLGLGAGALIFLGGEKAPEPYNLDPGEYFVTDIQESLGLLKSDLIIQMRDKQEQKVYAEEMHIIRNDIIFILRNKTETQLKTPDIENQLSEEICSSLNQEFDCEDFQRVYFNEFAIQ